MDTLTVRELLDHSGGFYDYLEINADPSDEALSEFVTGWFADNIMLLAPSGRMWNYSNPNYYVAGLVTERSSGTWYRQYEMDHVFVPLGMTRTYFLGDEVLADGDYAAGLTGCVADCGLESPIVAPDSYDNGWARPAGFAWSSVLDLSRFGQFLMYGDARVLSATSWREIQRPQINTETLGDLLEYGFGLMVFHGFFVGNNYYETTLLQHDGAIPGYSADLFVLPELEYGFVSLASTDGAYLNESLAIALELGDLPRPSMPPDLEPKPETFGDFVGHYTDPWRIVGPLDVTLRDQKLVVSAPLLDAAQVPYVSELIPYTTDNFYFVIEGSPLLLTFIRDDSGESEYARTRVFVCKKDEEARVGTIHSGEQEAPFDTLSLSGDVAASANGLRMNAVALRQQVLRASSQDRRIVQFGPPAGRARWPSFPVSR